MTGIEFEERIEKSCDNYREKGIALVHKIPTPWNVSYDRSTRRVKRAFPEKKSSVDFEGIWNGRSLAFEAKSTEERKRFPLNNVQEHQQEYLKLHQEHGGISFFLIEFSKFSEVYLMTYDQMENWMKQSRNGGRKSIPYHWFLSNCEIVVPGRTSRDFIKVLERMKVNESRRKNSEAMKDKKGAVKCGESSSG